MILEFAAVADEKISEKVLGQHMKAIKKLQKELEEINSPYKGIIQACIMMLEQSGSLKAAGGAS